MGRYKLFSFLLVWAVSLLVYENVQVWTRPPQPAIKKEAPKRAENRPEAAPAPRLREPNPPNAGLQIAEKNIFNPDRKEFPVQVVEAAAAPKPVVRPQLILYGVTLAENYQAASATSPGRPLRKGEREMMTLKIGDRVGEYRVAKILPDRIALETAGDSFEVLLYDGRAPKKRLEVRTPVSASKPAAPPPPGLPGPVAMPLAPPGSGAVPPPITPQRPPGRSAEPAVEQPPRPVPPSPVPDPRIWRGRAPISPLPQGGGNR